MCVLSRCSTALVCTILLLFALLGPARAADAACTEPHCLYLPYTRGAVPPRMPDNWLARVNAYRAAAGLPPVVENTHLSTGAALHVQYLLLNPERGLEHDEDENLPGFTYEGRESARQSNLFRSSRGYAASDAIDVWMRSLYHRYGILRPELQTTGFAFACNELICVAALNVLGDLDDTNALPAGVVYPGDGQRDVQVETISWQFYPFGPRAVLTDATLRAADGTTIPMTATSPNAFWNVVSLKPAARLAAGTTYTVNATVKLGDTELRRTWSFTTRS